MLMGMGERMGLMISLSEASKRLGIPERTLRDLAARKEFPARKVGKRWKVTVAVLEKWVADGDKAAAT